MILRVAMALLLLIPIFALRNVVADDYSDIPIIDTHIHLYDTTRPQGLPWPEPADTVLYRPVLPPDFDRVADKNGITATVIVEASVWLADNQWVLDLVKHNPERYIGLVGSLEIGSDDFAANLRELSRDPRFVGIRLRQRPRGDAFFNDAVWRDLQLLAELDQTLDVLMFEFSLSDVAMIAKRLPSLKILINHVAGADINGQPVDPQWADAVAQAAAQPNVHCKISGLFQQSHRSPSPTDLAFYDSVLVALWEAFGADRLIYGSNWPVTMRGGDYGSYKAVVMEFFAPKGRAALEKLLYKNALQFYGLPPLSDGFRTIFDGKTLEGWHAQPEESTPDWSVREGKIVGEGSVDRQSFLTWREDDLTDFELKFSYRLPDGKGNTGVDIRMRPDETGKRDFEAYHADLGHVGIGPGVLGAWDFHFGRRTEYPCARGTRLIIQEDGVPKFEKIPGALTADDVHRRDWNDVHIIVRGHKFHFRINGKVASEFEDHVASQRFDNGPFGLQIHDKGMRVEFKGLRLKRLDEAAK